MNFKDLRTYNALKNALECIKNEDLKRFMAEGIELGYDTGNTHQLHHALSVKTFPVSVEEFIFGAKYLRRPKQELYPEVVNEIVKNPDLELLPTVNEESRQKYKDLYGTKIVDFGAGTLHDTRVMREAGFTMLPFEPYYIGDGHEPDPQATRELISTFLDDLHSSAITHEYPTAVISSFVLNSIPHHKDRMAYLAIASAITKARTSLYLGTQDVGNTQYSKLDKHIRMTSGEANMTLGNTSRFFKAQKFFYDWELEAMLKVFFGKVELKKVGLNLFCVCSYPKRPNKSLLKEAIELEFNLPFKDGTTCGLHTKALEVFSVYTGIDLTS